VERLLLRPSEAAELTGLSRAKVYQMIWRNELPGVVRIGRNVRIHAEALRRWVDTLAGEANDDAERDS